MKLLLLAVARVVTPGPRVLQLARASASGRRIKLCAVLVLQVNTSSDVASTVISPPTAIAAAGVSHGISTRVVASGSCPPVTNMKSEPPILAAADENRKRGDGTAANCAHVSAAASYDSTAERTRRPSVAFLFSPDRKAHV